MGTILNDIGAYGGPMYTDTGNTGVEDLEKSQKVPKQYTLYQNYPNPFNPITKIGFHLPKRSLIKLQIYNMLGQEIETILHEFRDAGRYVVDWNAEQYPSGIYLYRLKAGDYVETRKLILQK